MPSPDDDYDLERVPTRVFSTVAVIAVGVAMLLVALFFAGRCSLEVQFTSTPAASRPELTDPLPRTPRAHAP